MERNENDSLYVKIPRWEDIKLSKNISDENFSLNATYEKTDNQTLKNESQEILYVEFESISKRARKSEILSENFNYDGQSPGDEALSLKNGLKGKSGNQNFQNHDQELIYEPAGNELKPDKKLETISKNFNYDKQSNSNVVTDNTVQYVDKINSKFTGPLEKNILNTN